MVMYMSLKELRKKIGITQLEAAKIISISLRSYKTYENDESKKDSFKYKYIYSLLEKYSNVDEENGILDIEKIKKVITSIFSNYKIEYCYLFGSYAKKNAKPSSDIDLLISSDITGLTFYELTEILRVSLKKKVDLLSIEQIINNKAIINEILKDGIKIYG